MEGRRACRRTPRRGNCGRRPPGPMQGVLGEEGFPSPNPFFLLFFGFLGRRPRDPKGPELRAPKGGREERGTKALLRRASKVPHGRRGERRGEGSRRGSEGRGGLGVGF